MIGFCELNLQLIDFKKSLMDLILYKGDTFFVPGFCIFNFLLDLCKKRKKKENKSQLKRIAPENFA